MIGKVPPARLAESVLTRSGHADEAVLLGPTYGEDTAAIDIDGQILVVNADPLSLAAEYVGALGVHVVCNDVAASGADPRWMTNTMFLPDDDPDTIETITTQLDAAATSLGVAIIGGHAEYHDQLDRPLLSLTAMGVTDRYVPSGGAKVGDTIVLTGDAAIEGTAILATDFEDELRSMGVDMKTIDRAADFIDQISVVDASQAIREYATGMHDPTEGGILTGLIEMARAADLRFDIDEEAIPIADETRTLCEAMEVDPLRIFGSGALIATIPAEHRGRARDAAAVGNIQYSEIGTVTDADGGVRIADRTITAAPPDELYDLWT